MRGGAGGLKTLIFLLTSPCFIYDEEDRCLFLTSYTSFVDILF
jgi:hypothetical protein